MAIEKQKDVSKEMYGTDILISYTQVYIMGNLIFTYIPIIIYSTHTPFATNAQ